ncbi:MAG: MYG1 family protein [Nanoarchaeota archaeon]
MKTVAVHDGDFHADDVFAVAILKLIDKNLNIIRTRDPKEYITADLKVDVGNKYDPSKGDYDHHQKEGAGKRENGIPYASAGLIWKHFGRQLVKTEEAFYYIDKKIITPIDADDVGIKVYKEDICEPYTVPKAILDLNPKWQEKKQEFDKYFKKAVSFALEILKKEIKFVNSLNKIRKLINKAITDKEYIILDKLIPWKEEIIKYEKVKFVIYPHTNSIFWCVGAVSKKMNSFERRKDLPKEWAGLIDEELARVSGVKDAIFCHNNLFIAVAKTKEGAIKLAELALKN